MMVNRWQKNDGIHGASLISDAEPKVINLPFRSESMILRKYLDSSDYEWQGREAAVPDIS